MRSKWICHKDLLLHTETFKTIRKDANLSLDFEEDYTIAFDSQALRDEAWKRLIMLLDPLFLEFSDFVRHDGIIKHPSTRDDNPNS